MRGRRVAEIFCVCLFYVLKEKIFVLIKMPKTDRISGQAANISTAQIDAIMGKLTEIDPLFRWVFSVCRCTACRVSEALGLKWRNLTIDTVVIPKEITKLKQGNTSKSENGGWDNLPRQTLNPPRSITPPGQRAKINSFIIAFLNKHQEKTQCQFQQIINPPPISIAAVLNPPRSIKPPP